MRFEIIRQVFLKELRESLRDRRSLAVMFGIPLLMYPLLTLTMAGVTTSTVRRMSRELSHVVLVNPQAAPGLLRLAGEADSGVLVENPPNPRRALERHRVDAVIHLPEKLEAEALAGRPVQIRTELDKSRNNAGFIEERVDRLLRRYERWIIEQRLEARGVSSEVLKPLPRKTEDIASGEQRLGSRLAMLLPMMLLITGILGCFFPAVNATTAERELGTLETLLVTPVSKLELLVAKASIVFLAGLLTSAINMVSMTLVLWRIFSGAGAGAQRLTLDPGALALSFLATVPTLLFFSAAVLLVGLFSRSYREANAYATPVMLLSLVPTLVSLSDPHTTPALLVTPCVNTTLIIRDVLSGHASTGNFLLAFLSSSFYAGLLLSAAARVFRTENLVNPAWEPLSFRGLRRAGRPAAARRLPAVDEALALFGVSMLLLFYVSPLFQRWGLFGVLTANQLLLIAAPALLLAWLAKWDWRETFSLRRASWQSCVGGVLIGLGLVPWINLIVVGQDALWPMDPELVRNMTRMFLPSLQAHPVLAPLLVGTLAGVCEELLYRGPLLSALSRKLPAGWALVLGGLLFGVAHMYLHGVVPIALAGAVLGWVTVRTGSVFPAMLLHFTYDATKLGLASWAVHTWGADRMLQLAADPTAGTFGPLSTPAVVSILAAGAVCLAVGMRLCWAREAPASQAAPVPAG